MGAATLSGTLYESDGTTAITGNADLGVDLLIDPCDPGTSGEFVWVDSSTGTFSITGISSGTYYLQAFTSGTNYVPEFWADPASVSDCNDALSVTVADDTTETGKDFQLDMGGSVTGTLYQSDGTTAITGEANLGVELFSGSCDNMQWISYTPIDSANGTFTITGVVPDTYYVHVNTSGSYYTSEFWADPASVPSCSDAQTVTVTAGTITANTSFQLEQGGVISGTLRDSSGAAITGLDYIGVTIFQGSCDNLQWIGYAPVDSATGTYSTSGLLAGDYIIQTNMQGTDYIDEYWAGGGSVVDCADAGTITVTAGATNSKKDFQLDQGGAVTGTLYQADGTTAITGNADLGVDLLADPCDPGTSEGSGSVDPATGIFSITGISSGTYYLQALTASTNYVPEFWADPASVPDCSDAGTVTVAAGATTTGKDFQLDQGGSITGTLYQSDGMTPITGEANLGVELFSGSCDNMQWISYTPVDSANGTFTITGVVPDTYYVDVNTSGSYYTSEFWADPASVPSCSDAQTVTVTAGTTTADKNFQLDPAGSVTGVLYQADGTTPITGEANLGVELFSGSCEHMEWIAHGQVNESDGSYSVDGIKPGTYFLQTNTFGTNYISEYWADPTSVVSCSDAQTVTVTAGTTTTGRDFQLDEGIRVEGTVYDESGVPLNGPILVAVLSGDCSGLQYVTSSGINSDGTYSVVVSNPGDYYLQSGTYGGDNGYISEYWADPASVTDCSEAQKLTLAAGNTYTGKDFQLSPGGGISGKVYADDGTTPLTGLDFSVVVFADDPCEHNDPVAFRSVNAADATFTIPGLPGGNYYVIVETNDNGYVEEWWADPASVADCAQAQQVTVAAGSTTGNVDFQLAIGGTVAGTLYDEKTGQPITGLNGMRIKWFINDPCEGEEIGDCDVAVDGTFLCTGAADGTYYARTQTRNDYVDEWRTATGSDLSCANADAVVVSNAADVTGVDFSLSPGSHITGHVYESDGKTPIDPLGRELRVQVFVGNSCQDLTYFASAYSFGADGSYQTPALADGTYYLRFKESGTDTSDDLHRREWWADPLSTSVCSGARKVVVSGTTDITGKDFQIDKAKQPFSWSIFLPAILQNAR